MRPGLATEANRDPRNAIFRIRRRAEIGIIVAARPATDIVNLPIPGKPVEFADDRHMNFDVTGLDAALCTKRPGLAKTAESSLRLE